MTFQLYYITYLQQVSLNINLRSELWIQDLHINFLLIGRTQILCSKLLNIQVWRQNHYSVWFRNILEQVQPANLDPGQGWFFKNYFVFFSTAFQVFVPFVMCGCKTELLGLSRKIRQPGHFSCAGENYLKALHSKGRTGLFQTLVSY